MSRGPLLGVLAVTVTSVLWGTTGTAATFAPEAGPLAIGAAALGIGGLLQAAIAVPELWRSRTLLRPRRALVLLGALAVAVYPLAFYSSMHLAGVAIGSVVSLASAPLASGALERIVEGRALSRWWMLAAGLGIIGSVLLCVSALGDDTADPRHLVLGITLGLVAGASYALFSWVAQRLMRTGVARGAAMGAVFGLGGTFLLPVLLLTGAPLIASSQAALTAGYMALVPMFLGYLLFGYGLTKVAASMATTITLTEPAVAAVLAVLVVGERLSALGWTGLGVLAAVLAVLAVAPANAGSGEAGGARTGRAGIGPAGTRPAEAGPGRTERGVTDLDPADATRPASSGADAVDVESLTPSASTTRGRSSPRAR
ncbi:EamA family transporter [Brevibacterium album]|uniref:EamA family transporter n=1 Tax=Brevibacterium album TaxID=417948 RepID=UPI0004203D64